MANVVEKAVGLVNSLTEALDGNKKGKDEFSGGIAGAVVNGFNNLSLFLQRNAAQLQDIQLNISRQLGSTRNMAYETMQRAVDITTEHHLDQLYGFSAQDYQKGLFNIQSNLGRQVGMGIGDAGVFAAGDVLFGDSGKTMGELSATFLHLGSNMESVGESVAKMFNNAHKSGLSFQKISSTVKSHLKEVNQYGFKNGIDGLRQMAEYAEQIGMDMSQALKASGKMNSLTGATDVAAKLSILGGNFQRLANPLEMLNESLTDVESLQRRIGDMFKGVAKWDAKKGMVSVSAVDRMRINEAASALGLDSREVFKSVETQARRDMIEKQIGLGLSPELKNLIANTGTINKDGRAGIIDNEGKFRDVSEIAGDQTLQNQILDLNKTEGENISNIAQNVQSLKQKMENYYERQVNLKTRIELGGRGSDNKGAALLRNTETWWSSEAGSENSFVNDLARLGGNIQKHATEGIDYIKEEALNGLETVYGQIREQFSAVTDVFKILGVDLTTTNNEKFKNAFNTFEKDYNIKPLSGNNSGGSGVVEEVGDITPGTTVKPAPVTSTMISPTTATTSQYTNPFINPTNNFTINISPESKYTWTNEDKVRIEKVVTETMSDIMREKEARANMTVGAY